MKQLALPPLSVIGSVNIDITHRVHALPFPGETVIATSRLTHLGGKGANQAAAAARLGAATTLYARIGDDEHGDFACAELARAGVDTSGVHRSGMPTGTAAIAVDDDGENLIIVDQGANAAFTEPPAVPAGEALLCQLEVPLHMIQAAIEMASGFVAINAAPALGLPTDTLDRADLLIVNEHEWASLPELTRCRRVVVTAGSEGASVVEFGRRIAHAPAVRTRVVNTVGAGDAFSAAVTLGFAAGLDATDALRTAAAIGAHAVASDLSQPPFEHFEHYFHA